MDENKDLGLDTAEGAPGAPAEEPSETLLPVERGAVEAAAVETDGEADAPDPEEDDDGPPADMVFGLRRRTFHLLVVGYALGIIFVALLGLAGLYPEDSGTVIPGVIGAAIGYALSVYLDKRDAAKEAAENAEGLKK